MVKKKRKKKKSALKCITNAYVSTSFLHTLRVVGPNFIQLIRNTSEWPKFYSMSHHTLHTIRFHDYHELTVGADVRVWHMDPIEKCNFHQSFSEDRTRNGNFLQFLRIGCGTRARHSFIDYSYYNIKMQREATRNKKK